MRASNTVVPARSHRSLAALIAFGVAAAATLALAPMSASHAATIDQAIQGVTITPKNPVQTSQLTTNIEWCVPDSTKQGDTFTLTLPSRLRNLPTGFTLPDPNRKVVATATISRATPAVVTFTMTSYAETHTAVCGTAYVRSDFDGTSTPSGKTTAFTSVSGDGRRFTTNITPSGTFGKHTQPVMYGTWSRADQGRTTPRDFLVWHTDTPTGPFSAASTVQTVPAGQSWRFDCTKVKTFSGTLAGNGNLTRVVATKPSAVACSTTKVAVTWHSQTVGKEYRVEVASSIPAATGTVSTAKSFSNKATVTTTSGSRKATLTAQATVRQAVAGGKGSGTPVKPVIRIVVNDSTRAKGDTAATAARLSKNGSATLSIKVFNAGTDVLTGIRVSDRVLTGGRVTKLSCDFARVGGPKSGTAFSGKLAVGAYFYCSASLTGVPAGHQHHDVGTASARGVGSGTAVSGSNAFYANAPKR